MYKKVSNFEINVQATPNRTEKVILLFIAFMSFPELPYSSTLVFLLIDMHHIWKVVLYNFAPIRTNIDSVTIQNVQLAINVYSIHCQHSKDLDFKPKNPPPLSLYKTNLLVSSPESAAQILRLSFGKKRIIKYSMSFHYATHTNRIFHC